MAKTKTINLLPQEEFDASVMGRVLKWAMGSFRIIVIVTEMIVMGAFLSRFWLDAQNSDLTDNIQIKSAQILSQKDFEQTFRNTQAKLDIAKQIAASVKPTDKTNVVSAKIPVDVVLSNVSIQESSAQIKGISSSEISIAQFISNLKSDKSFKTVELGQLSTSESNPGATVFTVDIKF